MAPQTQGALIVYKKVLSPLFKKNEDSINKLIDDIKDAASKAQDAAMDKAREVGTAENMMNAASKMNEAKAKYIPEDKA